MPIQTIGIDTRWLEGKAAAAGTNTYIQSLVRSLLAQDSETHYQLWGSPVDVSAPNVHQIHFSGAYRRAWQLAWKTVGWPKLERVGPTVDLWHFTNYVAPPTSTPFVISILDLSFVHHPEYTDPTFLPYLQKFVPDTLARAEQVIAISEATKRAIVDEYHLPEQKITVTPLAGDARYATVATPDEIAVIKDKYGIEGEYFLAVGTLEPRKNLKALLLAFAAIRRETTEQLVIVGGQGWLFEETQELLRKLGLGNRVIFTGYAPTAELPALYQGAKLFVFPSHYEGFGLPVLEAMMSGTAVICSNTSSLPEVGGEAVLYFDPADTDALKGTLLRALADHALRERLVEAGRKQAATFSWDRTSEQTLAVYRAALAGLRS